MADAQPGNQPRSPAPGRRHPIGGGAITSYLSLRSDIQEVRAALTVRVSEHEVRLATIEHSSEDQRKEVREFQGDVRSAISRVTDLLSDVRIQLGRRKLPHN